MLIVFFLNSNELLGCSEYTPDSTDYWTKLSKKINGFAEELNTIENGGYITISRLKVI